MRAVACSLDILVHLSATQLLVSSRNRVIVFSPFSPLRATAAASPPHSQVAIYRLITARTYEAQMFERASKKLSLDQAVLGNAAVLPLTPPSVF